MFKKRNNGFTLLEILIALFIFSIISLILMRALHNVINIQARTEQNAERLRNLQNALLIFSRDLEQTINRPILNVIAKAEPPLLGSSTSLFFTHMGVGGETQAIKRSSLQRIGYVWHDNALWRLTFNVLDQAPNSQPHVRKLLGNVSSLRFEYLDQQKRFRDDWPSEEQTDKVLPRAVRITLSLENWGTIKQLIIIPANPSNAPSLPSK